MRKGRKRWRLVNAEQRAKDAPETFYIPRLDELTKKVNDEHDNLLRFLTEHYPGIEANETLKKLENRG